MSFEEVKSGSNHESSRCKLALLLTAALLVPFCFTWIQHDLLSHLRETIGQDLRQPPCSLNGELVGGSCVCDKPWTGPDCSSLSFQPVTFPQGYGMSPNVTSWGGNAIFDDSMYHIFVSVMTNGCPLQKWTTNSRIEHGIASQITGPYEFKDVAVNTWSHNAAPVVLKDGTFAIFHIGYGDGPPDGGDDCARMHHAGTVMQRPSAKATAGSTIHVSKSLHGPWTALHPNKLIGCDNPAPWVHMSNGTIYIVCRGGSFFGSFLRADNITGPWTLVSQIRMSAQNGPVGTYEDPFLYSDQRGLWHLLYHMYITTENPPHGHECVNSTVSAHAYSLDGFHWFVSPHQPYTT